MKVGKIRWIVCGLLFLVTADTYFDRQVFGVLAPELIKRLHWHPGDYADIVTWFDVAYGIGFLVSGRFLDVLGTRLGLAVAVAAWSVVAMAHAAVSSILGFKIVRALLGLTEASHLPGAIKAVAEWFPPEERALSTGIYKAGGDIGAIAVPPLVAWLYLTLGWRWAFAITGVSGFFWLFAWLAFYRQPEKHPRVSAAELAWIRRAPSPAPDREEPVPWKALLRRRETYGYAAAKFLTDAVWHWYQYLLPLFLSVRFKLNIKEFWLPLIAVYALSDVGSIGGGWLSSALMKRGCPVTPARKLAMLVCCCFVLPVVFAPSVTHVWVAVILVGLAMAAHQGWTSNLFTTVSDRYPQAAIGSIVGFGGACGMGGAALLALFTGHVMASGGSFAVIFLIAGVAYPAAFGIFHFLAPSLEMLKPEELT